MKVIALRGRGIGTLLRRAVLANDAAKYHHISRRVTAGRDAAGAIVVAAGGRLHACPRIGGNSFLAEAPDHMATPGSLSRLRSAFAAAAEYIVPAVGAGPDIVSAVADSDNDAVIGPPQHSGAYAGASPVPPLPRPDFVQVLSADGNGIGAGLRAAIASNSFANVDAYSARVVRGMDGAISIATSFGGVVFGAGGDNFSAFIRFPQPLVAPMKLRFIVDTIGLTIGVGIGFDLRTSHLALAVDKGVVVNLLDKFTDTAWI